MSKKEDTPFVVEFEQRRRSNYGSARPSVVSIPGSITRSAGGSNNNNNNSSLPGTPSTLYCLHGTKNIEVRDHCHRSRSEGVDVGARKKLIIASVLCLVFMICEIVGGVLSNSLAIATDAAHLLTDLASFMISLFAIWIAGRPSTQRMSFGWYRAEVIGAMASVVMIWFITAILLWLAIERVVTGDYEVDAEIMLITSGLAILVNVIMGCQLQHGHSHGGMTHSHGDAAHKSEKQLPLPHTVGDKLSSSPLALDTPKCSQKARVQISTPSLAQNSSNEEFQVAKVCPKSPNQNLENGSADLLEADAQLPAGGLESYSYQNTLPVCDSPQPAMAAVLAETSAGTHHHGGQAAKAAVNMNVRAAYIHVLGDVIQSVGVFIAALIIYFRPDWAIADPICTFIFSIIVLFTTFAILKDALLVLMEGTPTYLQYAEVLAIFQQIEGVERVHNLRIWALSINKIALSVHLAIGPGANPKQILQDATTAVHMRYNFFETTIQIEDFTPQMEDCQQCTMPEM